MKRLVMKCLPVSCQFLCLYQVQILQDFEFLTAVLIKEGIFFYGADCR